MYPVRTRATLAGQTRTGTGTRTKEIGAEQLGTALLGAGVGLGFDRPGAVGL